MSYLLMVPSTFSSLTYILIVLLTLTSEHISQTVPATLVTTVKATTTIETTKATNTASTIKATTTTSLPDTTETPSFSPTLAPNQLIANQPDESSDIALNPAAQSKPEIRFTEWNNLETADKSIAQDRLGYSKYVSSD